MSNQSSDNQHLVKFTVASAFCFFVGTVHGVLQVIRPIRAWLDSIGSPYGGPGHMIDPLAHAHINVVGGVGYLLQQTRENNGCFVLSNSQNGRLRDLF